MDAAGEKERKIKIEKKSNYHKIDSIENDIQCVAGYRKTNCL